MAENNFRDSKANRKFQGIWIPAHLWFYDQLNMMEKMFYLEINSLDNEDGCYASNDYFSKFFGLSKSRCSEIIKSLEKQNIITIEIIYKIKEGKKSKEIDKRIIRVNAKWERSIQRAYEDYLDNREVQKEEKRKIEEENNPIRKTEGGYSKNRRGVFGKPKDNNIDINNNTNISLSGDQEEETERENNLHENVLLVREKTGLKLLDKKTIAKVSKWDHNALAIAIVQFVNKGGSTFKYLENGYNMALAGELIAHKQNSSMTDKVNRQNKMITHGDDYVERCEKAQELSDKLSLGLITQSEYEIEIEKLGFSINN